MSFLALAQPNLRVGCVLREPGLGMKQKVQEETRQDSGCQRKQLIVRPLAGLE